MHFLYQRLECSDLGRQNGAFGFPLAQDWLRRTSREAGRPLAIPGRLCMARRVEDPVADRDCVKPDPFLGRVEPLVLELLLADRTYVVDAARRVGNWNIFGSTIGL